MPTTSLGHIFFIYTKAALQRECEEIIKRKTSEDAANNDTMLQDTGMGWGHREKKAKQLLTSDKSSDEACIHCAQTVCKMLNTKSSYIVN